MHCSVIKNNSKKWFSDLNLNMNWSAMQANSQLSNHLRRRLNRATLKLLSVCSRRTLGCIKRKIQIVYYTFHESTRSRCPWIPNEISTTWILRKSCVLFSLELWTLKSCAGGWTAGTSLCRWHVISRHLTVQEVACEPQKPPVNCRPKNCRNFLVV